MVEKGKYPNPSDEHEPIGMEITLRNKIQNRIVNAPLDHIVPNGQVAEQESEQGKEQIKPSILIIPKGQAKDNPNECSP